MAAIVVAAGPTCCSGCGENELRLIAKGEVVTEVTPLVGAVLSYCAGVSSLVIASSLGTLLEPLAFLFFAVGPVEAEGEVCRDWLRGVIVADVV